MTAGRPATVTFVSWYAIASGAILALVPLAIALDFAAQTGPSSLVWAVPGLIGGALAIIGGQGSLQGRPWARAVLLSGLACGIIVGGMLFFLFPVVIVAVANVVATVAILQPDARAWFATPKQTS